jgi:hypothetical protein
LPLCLLLGPLGFAIGLQLGLLLLRQVQEGQVIVVSTVAHLFLALMSLRLVGFKARSTINNLEENEEWATRTAQRVYEAAGITAQDVAFENAYDGFSLFHVFWIEGFGFFGIKRGETLDFFASQDISINGPTPISPSGGNIGSGRTRYWNWADTIQQVQGRAGERQIKKEATIGVTGSFMPPWSSFAVFSKDPSGGA